MAELASLRSVQTSMARVVVLAGEALVKVQTFLLLCAPLKQVKLAEFHYFWRVSIMREHAVERTFWALS